AGGRHLGDVVGGPGGGPRRLAGAGDRHPAVGAGAHADVVLPLPVDQVVARAGDLPAGVVGNLVGVEAGGFEHGLGGVEQLGPQRLVGWREDAAAHGAVEGGARFDGELVGRDVLRAEVDRAAELLR